MKRLPLLIPLTLAVLVLIVAIQNASVLVDMRILGYQHLQVSVTVLILALLGLAVIGAGLPLLWWTSANYRQYLQQDVQKQKAQLNAEASQDKVEALERKIQTLEKALEKALSGS